MISWYKLKKELKWDNMDADFPEEYLHISWDDLRDVLIEFGVVRKRRVKK